MGSDLGAYMGMGTRMSREALEAEAIELTIWAVTEWTGDGLTQTEVIDRLAQSVDAALQLDRILHGPVGELAEAIDGEVATAGLTALAKLRRMLSPSPERLRKRADNAERKGRTAKAESLRRRARKLEASGT